MFEEVTEDWVGVCGEDNIPGVIFNNQHDPVVREECDGVDCSGTVKNPGSYGRIAIPAELYGGRVFESTALSTCWSGR